MTLEQQVKEILESPRIFEMVLECSFRANEAGFLVYYVDRAVFPGQIVERQEQDPKEILSLMATAKVIDRARGEPEELPLGKSRFLMLLNEARNELNTYVGAY